MTDSPGRPDLFYRFIQWIPRTLWSGALEVEGLENIPASGAFILISNHQSNLDPILTQCVCPRPIHAMAKSTQFGSPLIGPLMKRLHAFPVRRYRTDPQAVRLALRRLEQGHPIGIYVEGERSWDGRIKAPRPGTIRLLLKAGVPIVPCTITGSYAAWPRWDRRPQRHPVRVLFGPSFRLPRLDDRSQREAALADVTVHVMSILRSQLASIVG